MRSALRTAPQRPGPVLAAIIVLLALTAGPAAAADTPAAGTVVLQFPAPGSSPCGLAWDGEALWVVDAETELIYRVDVDSGETLKAIHCPSSGPQGLTWDGEYLWLCDERDDIVALVTDDPVSVDIPVWPRGDIEALADRVLAAARRRPANRSTGIR